MEKLLKRVYTKEFKDEAAQLVVNRGMGLTEAARRLSISVKLDRSFLALNNFPQQSLRSERSS